MDTNIQGNESKNVIARVINLNASAEAPKVDARKSMQPPLKLPVDPITAAIIRYHIKQPNSAKEEAKLPPVVLIPKSVSDGIPRSLAPSTVTTGSSDASKAAYGVGSYRKLLNKLSNPVVSSDSSQAESSKTTAGQIASKLKKIMSGPSILNSAHTKTNSPNISKATEQVTISNVVATSSKPVNKPVSSLGPGLHIRIIPQPQPSLLNDKINAAATLKKHNQVYGSDGAKDGDRKTTTAHYVIKKDAVVKFKEMSSMVS